MGQFSIDVSAWCAQVPKDADKIYRKVCIEVSRGVIMMSPVDEGRFRGNWQAAIGSPPSQPIERKDKSGGVTVADAVSVAAQLRTGMTFFLVNNLPYALPLEYGHSKQAPAGMVRVTVARWQDIVSKAASETRQGQ